MEISYSGKEDTNFNPLNLSIYKGSEGNWEEVLSKVDKGRKLVVGEIDQLGSFKLVYDPSSQSEEI
ncbi:MAG: hypothetical protein GWN00_21920, partial [Aliifodinibius sp.]|nr:hypothetical protein [Fodinibius sp.]NIV13614.1 hypothetical protein [Fodinibius sp.]NIY27361.1 hypothetical protein [Fodinibius sp.]